MRTPPFRENVVIITGASTGIGRELALQLADQGAWLVLAARDAEKLKEVADQCRQRNRQALAVPTDVVERSQCRNLIERAVAEYGRIDTLVNNAGMTMRARFDELSDPGLIDQIMQVNLMGCVYCTHYALPYLKKTQGRIVGISSLSGKLGVPMVSGYVASKHAMAGFFNSLRVELAGNSVSVTMIYPSFVATGVRQIRPGVIPVDICARLIIQAAARRQRELVMSWLGRVGLWVKLIAPTLVDRVGRMFMEREEYAVR